MGEDYLLLDSSIRDWVVIPIFFIIIVVGIGRHYVGELIKSTPKVKSSDIDEIRYVLSYYLYHMSVLCCVLFTLISYIHYAYRYKQILMQGQRLRQNGHFINNKAFNTRKLALIRKKTEGTNTTGLLREKVPGGSNPMANPMNMVDMMKGNLVNMLPNFSLMAFVGYFFSGFVCLKVPFPMPSNHFRSVLVCLMSYVFLELHICVFNIII